MNGESLLKGLDELLPHLNLSLYFSKDGKNYITKHINGEYRTEEACKDPNYKGHRYIWKSEV